MAQLPASVSYGKVVGQFLLAVGDNVATPDGDTYPDAVPAQGYVTFNAAPDYVLNTSSGAYTTIYLDTIVCPLDANGFLTDPAGAQGVWLVATDDPDNNPTNWTYTVTITLTNAPTIPKTFSISVASGSTQDLTTITPVADNAGTPTIVGPPGPANTLSIGTVTTGAVGAAGSASITGTSPNQILNLTLPVAVPPAWLSGAGAPAGGTGVVGDWYLNLTNSDTYKKTAVSTWTLQNNIKGATGATGPANTLTIGTVTTGAAGSSASSTITGTSPNQTLNLTIPRGDTGATGPANSLSIGTVTQGTAAATITGTAPTQTLNLTLPPGPSNTLAIGTVTTLAAGASATSTITGTSPNQTLNLGIPAGVSGGQWLNGTAPPATGSGIVGDWYLVTSGAGLGDVYKKTGVSTWSVQGNIRGAAGTMAGPASSVADNIASFTDASGSTLKDSGIGTADLMRLSQAQTVTGVKTFSPGLVGTPWALSVFGGSSNDGTAVRIGSTSSYPNYVGTLFGTNTYGGIGTVMADNGLQLTNIGGEFRVQTGGAGLRKDVAYTSKTDATKEFVFATDNNLYSVPPGSTFTVGGVTYTVRSARGTAIRVVEDISAAPATGTLTQVLYANTRMTISTAGVAAFSGILTANGGLQFGGRTALDNSMGLSGGSLYIEGASGGSIYLRPDGAGINTGMVTVTATGATFAASVTAGGTGFSGAGANITGVVHTTGAESVAGVKTFTNTPQVTVGGLTTKYGGNDITFERAAASSYITQNGLGGNISFLTSDVAQGDVASLILSPTSATFASGKFVSLGNSGLGAPTFTTRSAGTKIVLYDSGVSASFSDYAIGMESNAMWHSVRAANSTYSFKWYGGETVAATLTGSGDFTTVGTVNTIGFNGRWAELGRTDGTASTPFIDFHSSATAIDYDTRIISTGGNGATNGAGAMTITANGGITLTSSTGVTASGPITAAGTGFSGPGANITGVVHTGAVNENIDGQKTFLGVTTIDGPAQALNFKPGSNDHVYMAFYARTATPTVRSGYFGYSNSATTAITLRNDLSAGNINLSTNGGTVSVTGGMAVSGWVELSLGTTKSATLGTNAEDWLITQDHLQTGNTNAFYHRNWMRRRSAGTDWVTADIVDGISIDTSYGTPLTARSWWRRNPQQGLQEWGDAGVLTFGLNATSLTSFKFHYFAAGVAEKQATASGTSGTVTLDAGAASLYTLTPTGNVTTLTITGSPATGNVVTLTLVVNQGATPYTIATPSGGVFVGAATPTQVANKKCVFTYVTYDGGSTWLCSAAVQV